MPTASPVGGSSLAKYDGKDIPEIEARADAFPTPDIHIHFGLNGTHSTFTTAATTIGWQYVSNSRYVYADLGPRVLDIAKRGGRVAELNWFIEAQGLPLKTSTKVHNAPLDYCLNNAGFDAFNKLQKTTGSDGHDLRAYPAQAKMDGGQKPRDVLNEDRYSGANKSTGNPLQVGTRWSKTALEYALRQGHWIEFHLDGLGDIKAILDKGGDYAYNVTGRELNYVFRHWHRFKAIVRFYNGYSAGNVMQVAVPWGSRPVPARVSPDPVVDALSKVAWPRWCAQCCKKFVAGTTTSSSRWHLCVTCQAARCNVCGADLDRSGFLSQTRVCPCGGTTSLLS